MESAVKRKRPPSLPGRLLRRVGSALFWTAVLVLGAFGVYFSFANYPWPSLGVLVLILVAIGYSERKRRARQKTLEAARDRARAHRADSSG